MKKIFIETPFLDETSFNGYLLSHLSYRDFFKKNRKISNIIKNGYSGSSLFSRFRNPELMQKMYLEKDSEYFKFLSAFKERYSDFDVIFMNPGVDLVHPEYLIKNFPNAIKVLHFVDDPHASYSYGFPYSWAFDAATYISPSYSEDYSMEEILNLVGFKNTKWFPLCSNNIGEPEYTLEELEAQLDQRNDKAVYIGNYYSKKNFRLAKLKKKLGKDLDIYGRFPLKGNSFWIDSVIRGIPTFYSPKTLTHQEREDVYKDYSIALNLHLSSPSLETGNARLYEVAYRGLAQVVDTSDFSLVSQIFQPDKEVLLYETEEECYQQIIRLQEDRKLRNDLAMAGYQRAIEEYRYEDNLKRILDWVISLNDRST